MGRVAESIAAYDEALRRAPRDRQALGGKAVALTAAGRAAEAEALEAEVERLDAEEQQLKEEAAASALEAAWGRGPERLIAMASEAAYRGDARAAVDWLLAGAAEYQGLGHLDGTLDACLRALHVAPGAPMVHLQMVRVYLERGWHALAAERLVLLDRLLQLDPDPGVRDEWRRLVATHRDAVPGLASLAP
jgi:tetratricopeptide (TPR) repeat protein